MDPIKDSIIVDAFCCAIDGYSKDLQSVKVHRPHFYIIFFVFAHVFVGAV